MPAPDPGFPHTPSGADDWFSSYPAATSLAGRVVPADELDEAAADALANAVAAFSEGRGRAARARARDAPTPAPRAALPDLRGRIASRLGAGGASNTAPAPIRTAGGWRNG
jgi:hypothetical protein